MDRFAVNESRMLYFHRVLLDQARQSPQLIERAARRLEHMRQTRPDPQGIWAEWAQLLDGCLDALAAAVLADTPRGGLLRANSPLAEALAPEEKNMLWQRIGLHQFTALYLRAARDLALTVDEQAAVLGVAAEQLAEWRDGPPATMAGRLLEPLKQVVAVHRALEKLFPEPDFGRAWLRSHNDLFAATPLELLMNGRGAVVQAHLTAALVPLLQDGDRPSH